MRGVEIEDDLALPARQRAHRLLEQAGLEATGQRHDFVVTAGGVVDRGLEPLERRRGGEGGAGPRGAERLVLAGGQRQERIAPQRRMVVEIFVAERDRRDALAEQLRQRVLDVARIACVAKTRRQPGGQRAARGRAGATAARRRRC